MTNSEAQAYAVVALNDLFKAGIVKLGSKVRNANEVLNKLDSAMYYLMDMYSEDEIVEKMERVMVSGE